MVVRFRKKVRKQRGKRWHGWGSKKKHRGKGSKGGKGAAGMCKHKWSYVTSKAKEHFGYKGFVPPRKKDLKIINLDDVAKLLKPDQKEIDLIALGYTKLLGRGEIAVPLIIKVPSASRAAIEKVEKTGGKVILTERVLE
jgi:large subunit ribosomal protein L15